MLLTLKILACARKLKMNKWLLLLTLADDVTIINWNCRCLCGSTVNYQSSWPTIGKTVELWLRMHNMFYMQANRPQKMHLQHWLSSKWDDHHHLVTNHLHNITLMVHPKDSCQSHCFMPKVSSMSRVHLRAGWPLPLLPGTTPSVNVCSQTTVTLTQPKCFCFRVMTLFMSQLSSIHRSWSQHFHLLAQLYSYNLGHWIKTMWLLGGTAWSSVFDICYQSQFVRLNVTWWVMWLVWRMTWLPREFYGTNFRLSLTFSSGKWNNLGGWGGRKRFQTHS